MKTFLWRLTLLLCIFAAAVTKTSAVGFTITPSAASNTYSGSITFQVTGLGSNDTVIVQKFLDANASGTVDQGDTLVEAFKLTDGKAAVYHDGTASVTNLNVPGDTDAVAGQITAVVNFQQSGFEQTITGNYLIVLTSPTNGFTPITNTFTVTSFPFAQSISGNVVANTTNVPGAAVLLFQPIGNNFNPVGGAAADTSGHYQINAQTGSYVLVAFRSNFVANVGAVNVTLNSGTTIVTNLSLISADRTISGAFVDAGNTNVGLPGSLVPLESSGGLLTVAYTDTNGNFSAGVTSDQWKVDLSDQAVNFHNYLRTQNKVRVDATTGSVSGVTIALPKASALFYGSVKDGSNQPLPGISLFSQDDAFSYEQSVTTYANGNYFAGALGGTGIPWQLQTSTDSNPTNYIFSQPPFNQNGGTNLNGGQAVQYNFTALLATNFVTGHVQDHNNNPIAGVQVLASATIGGQTYNAQIDTDSSGNYALNVANGSWGVSLSCQGGQDSLDALLGPGNYQCPSVEFVNVSNANGVANFTVQPCGGIQIFSPTNLPSGVVGTYYSNQLFASSCSGNINWSLNSGSLPPGINLYSGGAINGTPTSTGTFAFVAHVTDNASASTNVNFWLTINSSATPPSLNQALKTGSQFQFTVHGSPGQNYTVQTSTNVNSTNWNLLLVTNSANNTFIISDPNATNPARYYRILLGP